MQPTSLQRKTKDLVGTWSYHSYVKNSDHPNIYSKINISIADIKILLMIRYCVHWPLWIARRQLLNVHKDLIWCEIYILAHHSAVLIYIDKYKTREI